jgi:hypothetical protein
MLPPFIRKARNARPAVRAMLPGDDRRHTDRPLAVDSGIDEGHSVIRNGKQIFRVVLRQQHHSRWQRGQSREDMLSHKQKEGGEMLRL